MTRRTPSFLAWLGLLFSAPTVWFAYQADQREQQKWNLERAKWADCTPRRAPAASRMESFSGALRVYPEVLPDVAAPPPKAEADPHFGSWLVGRWQTALGSDGGQ